MLGHLWLVVITFRAQAFLSCLVLATANWHLSLSVQEHALQLLKISVKQFVSNEITVLVDSIDPMDLCIHEIDIPSSELCCTKQQACIEGISNMSTAFHRTAHRSMRTDSHQTVHSGHGAGAHPPQQPDCGQGSCAISSVLAISDTCWRNNAARRTHDACAISAPRPRRSTSV